jgi:undecaprenyl-diphosphatase
MLTVVDSLILGAVEGLTEFLPVSSSGHLILARELLHINTGSGLAFDAILQLGTILAAFVYFRTDIRKLIATFWNIVSRHPARSSPEDRNLLIGIILGTIPALALGLFLKHAMETVFRSAGIVALTLIAGSVLFVIAERYAKQTHASPTVKDAWWVGVFQTLALVPGVSRSGATISGGLLLGLTRETAVRFSFLLSLPIIAGSGLLELAGVLKQGGTDFNLLNLALGFCVSFILGYICIRWLMVYLKRHTLMAFVWYRCALAAVVLAVLAVGR